MEPVQGFYRSESPRLHWGRGAGPWLSSDLSQVTALWGVLAYPYLNPHVWMERHINILPAGASLSVKTSGMMVKPPQCRVACLKAPPRAHEGCCNFGPDRCHLLALKATVDHGLSAAPFVQEENAGFVLTRAH